MILRELVAALGLDFDQRSFDKGENALRRVKQVAVGLAGALAANAVIRGFARIVASSVDAADEAAKASRSLGLTIQAYQGLSHAADLSGVSQDEFRQSLTLLSKNATAAAGGSKEQAAAFQKFGVKVKDSSGQVRTADQLLLDVADRFKTVKSPAERAALAMQLFGRSGAKMIPLLLEGRAGISKMADEVELLGAGISDDFAARSELFNDTITRIHMVFKGIKNVIAAALLPTLQRLLDKFLAWRIATKGIVNARLEVWMKGVAAVTEKVADFLGALGNVIVWASGIFGELSSKIAVAATILGGLALALGWPVILTALLSAAFVLLLEDIKVFSEGGTSLIGHLIDKYKEWVTSFTDPSSIDPNEHWLMRFLREVVGWAEKARKAVVDVFEWGLGGKPGRLITGGGGAAEGPSVLDGLMRSAAELVLGPPVQAVSPGPMAQGGGSSIKVDVAVNGAPGQDEAVIADIAAQRIEERLMSHFNDARAALTPSAVR